MGEAGFLRARRPEQKAERRRAILAAAATVLDREGLEGVSLAAIAAEAGVVKSGLYRYFESREEILLRLLLADMDDLCIAFDAKVGAGDLTVPETAAIMAGGFIARPRLCLLISEMAATLERNVSGETLRDVKREIVDGSHRATATLARALPALGPERSGEAVLMLYVLVAGLWPMTQPSPELSALLDEPEFAPVRKDFTATLQGAALAMLTGLSTTTAR
ncbi:MAG: TetR family transcriptional regulator [Pseudomonadota bacterium]